MPQVDLETLFRGGSGRKIVCESLFEPAPEPDLPAESFRLPAEEEADWIDRNAVLDRKQSTKRNCNHNPTISAPNSSSSSFSSSKRFKSKPSVIIGLPKRPDCRQLCTRPACRPPGVRFFPKPASKSAQPEAEPGSPKVSCIGRVRSKKAKDRRRKQKNSSSSLAGREEERRLGFWARFVAVFACRHKVSGGATESASVPETESAKVSVSRKSPAVEGQSPTTEAATPGLGGLKRFSSGRRSDSWGQVDTDAHVA